MKIGAVITAAGKSSRMGAFKPLLKIGEYSVIEWIVSTFHSAGVVDIVVVTGFNSSELENNLKDLNIVFLKNHSYEYGEMFDSVKIGLDFLKDNFDKILLTPVDTPFFSASTIKALLSSGADASVPAFNGQSGHPVLIDNKLINEILLYNGDAGLKGALASISVNVRRVEADDSGILYNINTQADYDAIVRFYNEHHSKHS